MSDSITLHPELGVNPRLTVCTRCGAEGKDLLLLGIRNYWVQCDKCNARVYGGFNRNGRPGSASVCPSCGGTSHGKRHELKESERIPHGLCAGCEKELAMQKEVVESGGIYFKCKCGAAGVIKESAPICKAVRERAGIAAPAPVGVELDDCPSCTKEDSSG